MKKASRANPDISISACSYRRVLEIISNKWTALVIYSLEDGSQRYGEIRRRIEGVSHKMLTQTLRQLERDGLIERTIHPSVPATVEYMLTSLGETLIPLMRQLSEWAHHSYSLVEQSREDFDMREG